jgi:hypothetical protein
LSIKAIAPDGHTVPSHVLSYSPTLSPSLPPGHHQLLKGVERCAALIGILKSSSCILITLISSSHQRGFFLHLFWAVLRAWFKKGRHKSLVRITACRAPTAGLHSQFTWVRQKNIADLLIHQSCCSAYSQLNQQLYLSTSEIWLSAEPTSEGRLLIVLGADHDFDVCFNADDWVYHLPFVANDSKSNCGAG